MKKIMVLYYPSNVTVIRWFCYRMMNILASKVRVGIPMLM